MANLSIIRELCKEKNISLKKLGEAIGITTPQGVQRMINENSTTIDRLEKISKLLNVPIWRFFEPDLETAYIMEIEQQKNRSKIIEESLEMMSKNNAELITQIKNMRMAITILTTQGMMLRTGTISLDVYDLLLKSMINYINSDYEDGESLMNILPDWDQFTVNQK